MAKPFKLSLSEDLSVPAVEVFDFNELPATLRELGFHRPQPTLVLVGGAAGLRDTDMEHLRPLFIEVLAPSVENLGALVVDGGTDAGVMRMMGQARAETDSTFLLIGVVIKSKIDLTSGTSSTTENVFPEPNHTHFIFVPGSDWGDESPWLDRVAKELANVTPSVTVLINGGEIARKDVEQSLSAGRPVLVISGTGRLADELAKAPNRSPLLHVVNFEDGSDRVTEAVIALLKEAQDGKI